MSTTTLLVLNNIGMLFAVERGLNRSIPHPRTHPSTSTKSVSAYNTISRLTTGQDLLTTRISIWAQQVVCPAYASRCCCDLRKLSENEPSWTRRHLQKPWGSRLLRLSSRVDSLMTKRSASEMANGSPTDGEPMVRDDTSLEPVRL